MRLLGLPQILCLFLNIILIFLHLVLSKVDQKIHCSRLLYSRSCLLYTISMFESLYRESNTGLVFTVY